MAKTPGIWLAVTAMSAVGCNAQPVPETAQSSQQVEHSAFSSMQIVIKFRDTAIDPASPGFITGFSRELGLELEYLRPVYGGAHVFQLRTLPPGKDLKDLLQELSSRPDIEYAEENAILKPLR